MHDLIFWTAALTYMCEGWICMHPKSGHIDMTIVHYSYRCVYSVIFSSSIGSASVFYSN